MAMKMGEFLAFVEQETAALGRREAPRGVETCIVCSVPLQETITGMRPCGFMANAGWLPCVRVGSPSRARYQAVLSVSPANARA